MMTASALCVIRYYTPVYNIYDIICSDLIIILNILCCLSLAPKALIASPYGNPETIHMDCIDSLKSFDPSP